MKSHYESEADREYHLYFRHTSEISIGAHFHKNVEMLFITKGCQTVFVNGKTFTVEEGEGLFVHPYEIHSYAKNDIEAWVVVASERYLKDYRELYCKNGKEFYPPEHLKNKAANASVTELLGFWYQRRHTGRLEIQGWIDLLFSRITQIYPTEEYTRGKGDAFALNALSYIDAHYDEEITLGTLASEMGYSRNYCSMLFNKFIGESFSDYLNRVRLSHAEVLIEEGNTVDFALRKTGFSSRATFYRTLNKVKGTSE